MAKQVKIDKAVIHRCDNEISQSMGCARQGRIAARCINDQKIDLALGLAENRFKQFHLTDGVRRR